MTTTLNPGDAADPRARLDRYLSGNNLDRPGTKIVPLTGDASDRRYYRVIGPDGPSIVVAVHAGPIEFATLPFANVARLLRQMPLPVPALLGHSDTLGIVTLEDLGDVTLQAHLGAASAAEHAALYREAVSFIELLQRRGAEIEADGYTPYGIAFDVEKLAWELGFFVKHFIEGYRGAAIAGRDRSAFDEEWASIVTELAAEPRVLCHRDYHSRNLMVSAGRLYIIDFQDARMGPDTYDLVSLLRDSYVELSDREVDELIAYFLALKGRGESADQTAAAEFRRRFDVMALQRNLKALGTFGYQAAARRNPVYIQYIPRTLRHVRTNLERHRRFSRLRELLANHIDELR
jgi:aminoglycoside/choline kinase family phosphotransferase